MISAFKSRVFNSMAGLLISSLVSSAFAQQHTAAGAPDIPIAKFESGSFGKWTVEGEAFGTGPVRGSLPGQKHLRGYLDNHLVNSYHGGETAKGVLTSPPFVIERDYINFLVGGGYYPGSRKTKAPQNFWGGECSISLFILDPAELKYLPGEIMNTSHQLLAVETGAGPKSIIIRWTTGPGRDSADTEELEWASWDLRFLKGKTVFIRIVDNQTDRDGYICVDEISQSDRPRRDLLSDPDMLRRANDFVEAAVREAKPRRGYHYQTPAQAYGGQTIYYHNGYYHQFYIYDAYLNRRDAFAHKFWKHTRSKDLVHWEDLPLAIWPSEEFGEHYCASGQLLINDDGLPMVIYSARGSERGMEQMAAIGDPDMLNWRKHAANPVLMNLPENPMDYGTDPMIFKHESRWYMILGAQQIVDGKTRGGISLHASDDLVNWEFVSLPYTSNSASWEEPDLFQLGDKWVLIYEPLGPSQYYTGTFDWETFTFKPEVAGFLDYSGSEKYDRENHTMKHFTGHFVVCTSLLEKKGRRVHFGHNPMPRGLSLPKVLTLRPDGRLAQHPLEELQQLRGDHYHVSDLDLSGGPHVIQSTGSDLMEMIVEFDPGSADEFGIRVRRSEDGQRFVQVSCDGQRLTVAGERVPADLMEGESTLRLHIFLDQNCMELFANDWVVYTENMTGIGGNDFGLELYATGGKATVQSLDTWQMKSIWPSPGRGGNEKY